MRTPEENQRMFGRESIYVDGEPRGKGSPPPAEYCNTVRKLRDIKRDAEEFRASQIVEVWDE